MVCRRLCSFVKKLRCKWMMKGPHLLLSNPHQGVERRIDDSGAGIRSFVSRERRYAITLLTP